MLLKEVLPSFAVELEQLLRNAGEGELAAQVSGLVIVDRCRRRFLRIVLHAA
jgi:hypothetical protein